MKPIHLYTLLLLTTVVLSSCDKLVEDLNQDPNNPSNASAQLLLTGLQLGNITVHEGHTARIAGIWSGYFTGTDRQYKDLQFYNASGGTFNGVWQNAYYGVFEQVKLLEDRARPLNNRWITGISKIIKAHVAGTVAAVWGDVPYTEASDILLYPNPRFEAQAVVYDKVQLLLDDALADLNSGSGVSPGVADIHFGGNKALWTDVIHTLKARFYLDVRNYQKACDEAQLGIKSAAGSFLAPHGTSAGVNENFYYTGRSITDMTSDGAYITTLLDPLNAAYKGNAKTNETARLNYYFTFTAVSGLKTKFRPNTTNLATQKGIFAQNASFSLVTYQENLLILAETAFRTRGFADGLTALNTYRAFLNSGGYVDQTYRIAGTYKYDPYAETDFFPGGIANTAGTAKDDALLKEILVERYVAFFGQKTGFNDIRRTRKEAAGVKVPANIGNVLPERFIYPQDEINSNANAPKTIPNVYEPTPINK